MGKKNGDGPIFLSSKDGFNYGREPKKIGPSPFFFERR